MIAEANVEKNERSGVAGVRQGIRLLGRLDLALARTSVILGIFEAAVPLVAVYMGKKVIETLSSGTGEVMRVVLWAIFLNLGLTLVSKWLQVQFSYGQAEMWRKKDIAVNNKLMEVDYEAVEDPRIHEKLAWLQQTEKMLDRGVPAQADYLKNMARGTFTLVAGLVMSLGVFSVPLPGTDMPLFLQNTLFLALIIALQLYSLWAGARNARGINEISESVTLPMNMLFSAYWPHWQEYSYGKDTRLYTGKALNNALRQMPAVFDRIYDAFMGKYTSIGVRTVANDILTMGLVYGFVGVKAYYGLITPADIVLYAGTVTLMMSGLTNLAQNYSKAVRNIPYLTVLGDFLDIESERYQGTLPVEKRDDNDYVFEVKNVSFKYPGSDKYALKDVNLKLSVGEKLAVVGMNGSGKTTLIKLLTRFYDPTEGEITLNGVDIRKFNYDEYLELFSVVFQDLKLFSFDIAQNVAAGISPDEERVTEALHMAGFDERLAEMPEGIHTYLYKNFAESGVEISGGEAQKIAMARALYKDAPFVILDEPTAALDPISEFEIYTNFDNMVRGRTAVYISHRLSSCRFCDDIAVFDEGRMVQRGSHDELLRDTGGKYYELWNAQAQYYKQEEIDALL